MEALPAAESLLANALEAEDAAAVALFDALDELTAALLALVAADDSDCLAASFADTVWSLSAVSSLLAELSVVAMAFASLLRDERLLASSVGLRSVISLTASLAIFSS